MNAKRLLVTLVPACALVLGACGPESPKANAPAASAPAAPKKDEPKADAGRPMPPSAPTAPPAEGEKK